MRWLGTEPSPGRRAANPSLSTWAMVKAARGPARTSAPAANSTAGCRQHRGPDATGAALPDSRSLPRAPAWASGRANRGRALGWLAGTPCTLEHGRVCDQRSTGHTQAGTQVRGLICPTKTKLQIPWLWGEPAAPTVWISPARPVGYRLPRQCRRAKGSPWEQRATSPVYTCVCTQTQAFVHALGPPHLPTYLQAPPRTNARAHRHTCVPRCPQTQALRPGSFPCPRQGCLPAWQRPASCHGNAAAAKR